jgi:hypothetical protein
MMPTPFELFLILGGPLVILALCFFWYDRQLNKEVEDFSKKITQIITAAKLFFLAWLFKKNDHDEPGNV